MYRIEKIIKKIRMARLEKGYSQEYVATQLEKSQVAYNKLETGKTKLTLKTLLLLSNILEKDAKYFFEFDEIEDK